MRRVTELRPAQPSTSSPTASTSPTPTATARLTHHPHRARHSSMLVANRRVARCVVVTRVGMSRPDTGAGLPAGRAGLDEGLNAACAAEVLPRGRTRGRRDTRGLPPARLTRGLGTTDQRVPSRDSTRVSAGPVNGGAALAREIKRQVRSRSRPYECVRVLGLAALMPLVRCDAVRGGTAALLLLELLLIACGFLLAWSRSGVPPKRSAVVPGGWQLRRAGVRL